MNAAESAVPIPKLKIVEQRAPGRQILRNRPPLATRRQNIHQSVHHLAQNHPALATALLAGRNQRLDKRPFRIGQVAGITQLAAIIACTVLDSPHRRTLPQIGRTKAIITAPNPQTQFPLTHSADS